TGLKSHNLERRCDPLRHHHALSRSYLGDVNLTCAVLADVDPVAASVSLTEKGGNHNVGFEEISVDSLEISVQLRQLRIGVRVAQDGDERAIDRRVKAFIENL